MSNTYVNPTVVAKETIMQLKNNCIMGNLVHRGYQKEWGETVNGWKKGQTINVKVPVYARVKDGATIDVADIREEYTAFTLSTRKHVAFKVTSQEMTLDIAKFSDLFIRPAAVALADYVDRDILGMYYYICNQVGTPGNTPTDMDLYLADAVLTEHAVPTSDRWAVIDPRTKAYMANNMKGMFINEHAKNAVERAKLPMISNFDVYSTQNVATHTCGTAAGLTTPLMDATSSEGDRTLLIDTNGSWTLTLTAGDIFTVAGTYGVNPISGVSTGQLRQFTCLSHTDNGNDATISCIPGLDPWNIYSEGAGETYLPYQNVYTLPTDNAAVSVAGSASLSHKVGLAAHKNAISLAMVPLEMPDSVGWGTRITEDGYSIRVYKFLDGVSDVEYIRFDILYGIKVINPFMACRIAAA